MNPFAFTRSWILVQVSITAGSDQAFALLAKIASNTSGPPIRSSRYSSHIIDVHFDWPPSENGATPWPLNTPTRFITSSQRLSAAARRPCRTATCCST